MSRSATSDNSSAVGLFPFLAVLLCTMGALLVLLVVLAQRIGGEPAPQLVAQEQVQEPTEAPEPTADPNQVAQLTAELEQIESYQYKLDELQKQGEQRLAEEQDRLSHLEEHTRRMEHELAELSLAAEQLKATEEEQLVDQQQAEQELARLEQMIAETEEQLEELRESAGTQRSYSVVPFKGKNGTHARPIYILCDEDGITIQPEGIKFQPSDFADTDWPGNPLIAALRASREHLNQVARRNGEPEPLDPYPLVLVRPNGTERFHQVRSAIRAWDARYGYEFIDSDWKLTYPELPDLQLARVQQHAVINARLQQASLASAAPRKFGGISGPGSHRSGSGGQGGYSVIGPYDSGLTPGSGDSATGEGIGKGGNGTLAGGTEPGTDSTNSDGSNGTGSVTVGSSGSDLSDGALVDNGGFSEEQGRNAFWCR